MTALLTYQWIPRKGCSLKALNRMRLHFHKPNYPMGEAWFMGEERRLYTELLNENPLEKIKTTDLSSILFEISSGTSCFGHQEEWDEWFKYLLPGLILHSQDVEYFSQLLVQAVISAFMSIYWQGIDEEYDGFRNDVIDSLSLCLMNDNLWFDYKDEKTNTVNARAVFLDTYQDGRGDLKLGWNSGQADENLSAMMFFCLKYLNQEEIVTWVKSLFAIPDEYWKGALMVWLLGAYDILNEPIVVPSKIEKANPEISWEHSHCLGSRFGSIAAKYPPEVEFNDNKDFLPSENIKLFLEEMRRHLTAEVIIEWAELFTEDKFAAESTYNVPEQLLEKLSY